MAAAICAPWPRSLEAACCALICALTVCEHSMASISALCGISHRSLYSSCFSDQQYIYTVRTYAYARTRTVKIISDLFVLAVEMQLAAVRGWIDLVCRSVSCQFLFIFFCFSDELSASHSQTQEIVPSTLNVWTAPLKPLY